MTGQFGTGRKRLLVVTRFNNACKRNSTLQALDQTSALQFASGTCFIHKTALFQMGAR